MLYKNDNEENIIHVQEEKYILVMKSEVNKMFSKHVYLGTIKHSHIHTNIIFKSECIIRTHNLRGNA